MATDLDYSAPWAQSIPGRDHSSPSSVSGYAAYAAALAGRYGPGGSFWNAHPSCRPQPVGVYEIWNEPDNAAFWAPEPTRRLRAALPRGAQRDQGAPAGRTRDRRWADHSRDVLRANAGRGPGAARELDGVAIHPYAGDPQEVLARVERRARGARLARTAGRAAVRDRVRLDDEPTRSARLPGRAAAPSAHRDRRWRCSVTPAAGSRPRCCTRGSRRSAIRPTARTGTGSSRPAAARRPT